MKYILNILFITIFTLTSHAQESDHEVGVWQFRTVDESDVENFLYNEDNVCYRQACCIMIFYNMASSTSYD